MRLWRPRLHCQRNSVFAPPVCVVHWNLFQLQLCPCSRLATPRPFSFHATEFVSLHSGLRQAQRWDAIGEHPVPLTPPAAPDQTSEAEMQLPLTEAAVWPEVTVEMTMESHATRLLTLEGRMGLAENKLVGCERTVVEFGNELESKWAVLGTLIQEYGLLQRRLENMENLLKKKDVWILRLPPGTTGEVPKVPVKFDEVSGCFSGQEWGVLEQRQKELHKNTVRSTYETLISLDNAVSTPGAQSRIEPWEEPRVQEQQESQKRETPMESGRGSPTSTPSDSSWIKQEETPCAESQGGSEEREIPTVPSKADEWRLDDGPAILELPGGVPRSSEEDFQRPAERSTHGSQCRSLTQLGSTAGCNLGQSAPCGGDFSGLAPTTDQEERRTGEGPYICNECGESFVCEQLFTMHQRVHAAGGACASLAGGEGLTQKSNLPSPQRSQALAEAKPYKCSEKDRSFSVKSSLPKHQVGHPGERPYSCAKCRKSFRLKISLLVHQRLHAGKGESSLFCLDCGKNFTHPSQLVRHQRIHTGERPFQCPACEKSFTEKSQLTNHFRTHTGERPYACAQCGKHFIRKHHLLKHQRVHTGERPYQCPECEKSFTQKYYLVDHRRLHTGERPFQCPACQKSFTEKSKLTNHFRIHTGERPYACAQCEKCFIRKHHLLKHQRVHTGERLHQCPQCEKSFRYKQSLNCHLKIHLGNHCPMVSALSPEQPTLASPLCG